MNTQDLLDSELRDHVPSISAREQSAQIFQIDSTKHATSMTFSAIVCGICMAITVVCYVHFRAREREVNNNFQRSENHWRDQEVNLRDLRQQVIALQKEIEHDDRRR